MIMNARDIGQDDFERNTQRWLDRLACGELDAGTRQGLLHWLDAEPLRWRACALSLLEAQAWNESLEVVEPKEASTKLTPSTLRQPAKTSSAVRWVALSSLAAALLVAFALGAFSRGWMKSGSDFAAGQNQPSGEKSPHEAELNGPLMATVSLKPELGGGIPATMQIPVQAVRDSGPQTPSISISEYDRQKWERRGYQLTKERRFLPAELPGGKKVVVPVERVKASYVGSKVS